MNDFEVFDGDFYDESDDGFGDMEFDGDFDENEEDNGEEGFGDTDFTDDVSDAELAAVCSVQAEPPTVSDIKGKRSIKYIEPSLIEIPTRVRGKCSVDDIVTSVKESGLLRSLIVNESNGTYTLVDGGRRLSAATITGLSKVPCEVYKDLSPKEIAELSLIANHAAPYKNREPVAYIECLSVEHGVSSPSKFEYLLSLSAGEYSKLKDLNRRRQNRQ